MMAAGQRKGKWSRACHLQGVRRAPHHRMPGVSLPSQSVADRHGTRLLRRSSALPVVEAVLTKVSRQ